MKILLYRGLSLISRAIRWQTRSPYSHAAIMLSDGAEAGITYEAWHTGGEKLFQGSVRKLPDPWVDHDPDTLIDIFGVHRPLDEAIMREYLESQVGKRYDFWSVGRFLTRRDAESNDKLFCSEYALRAFSEGGLDLLHMKPSHCAPAHLAISPLLHYEKTVGISDRYSL